MKSLTHKKLKQEGRIPKDPNRFMRCYNLDKYFKRLERGKTNGKAS